MNIVLASGSPRRKEILERLGVSFRILTSEKEEKITTADPEEAVKALAEMKAEDVYARIKDEEKGDFLVIGADTVVACDGKILGKPGNYERACEMIEMISGREHFVFTGVCLTGRKDGKDFKSVFDEKTAVFVSDMTKDEIEDYAKTGEPFDKAGGYAVQGLFAPYVERIEGDYYNVVGFPLSRTVKELKKYKIILA
ncbi:MAG: septum formation protein Maf [Lachnospiraceae bacterium]|nr:septum formation protein Maf [Lachnospiraceae bacterium]